MDCECGSDMRKRKDRNSWRWICRKKKECGKSKAFFNDTFFAGSHLSVKEIIHISYFWSRNNANYDEIRFQMEREETQLSDKTLCDWLGFCRDICSEYYLRNSRVIGGPNTVVEIDETCISRRKYNRGRTVSDQVWIFGGVLRGDSTQFFMEIVKDRSAATLLPLIQKYIAPGTTIMSDLWRAYGGISRLPEGYQHFCVNHSVNFIDPDTGANTQTVESMWQKVKAGHKKRFGTHRSLLDHHLTEFMWRQEFGGENAMYNFWVHLRDYYLILQSGNNNNE